jgi:thiol:disulfide interchange protein DsbD
MTRRLLSTLTSFLLLSLLASGCKERSIGEGPHIKVQLVSDHQTVSPGAAFTLGVKFMPEPGWHVYWRNPGDSGLPPEFAWKVTSGVSVKQPLWPYPERIQVGPLVNYGYGDVLIPFPASLTASAQAGDSLALALQVKWLVCKDECLPGEAMLELAMQVSDSVGEPSKFSGLFSDTFANVPAPLSRVSVAVEEQEKEITIALIPLEKRFLPNVVHFFPEDRRVIANAAPQQIERGDNSLSITLTRDPSNKEPISRIRGVLYSPQGWSEKGTPKAVSIDTKAEDTGLESSGQIEQSAAVTSVPPSDQTGFFAAVILAFLGGVLLNLMPCVFPVLSIKILGFVEQSKEDPGTIRLHGMSFAAGVLVSFWVLAGLLLSLQAGGDQLGWGFQLQSPTFVVLMILVFLLLGLMFLSDFALGARIQSLAGSAKLSSNFTGSFMNGVLATAVATPCTGPFMGSAIAATLTLPAFLSLLVFTSLGLGMSAPYLLLSFRPALLRFLPKPGAWMETFKELMAFPLFASVLWLVRVFARQMGMDASGLTPLMDVLWGSLAVGFGFWVLLRATHARRQEWRMALNLAAAFFLIYGVIRALPTRPEIQSSRIKACSTDGATEPEPDQHGLLWEPYSEARVTELVSSGRIVYIDFTAEWCITCQVNESRVFGSAEVRQMLMAKNVALLKGDWTSSNPVITQALKKYGRNGVPLNVILAKGRQPEILPNVLSPGIVLEALRKIAPQPFRG